MTGIHSTVRTGPGERVAVVDRTQWQGRGEYATAAAAFGVADRCARCGSPLQARVSAWSPADESLATVAVGTVVHEASGYQVYARLIRESRRTPQHRQWPWWWHRSTAGCHGQGAVRYAVDPQCPDEEHYDYDAEPVLVGAAFAQGLLGPDLDDITDRCEGLETT